MYGYPDNKSYFIPKQFFSSRTSEDNCYHNITSELSYPKLFTLNDNCFYFFQMDNMSSLKT